MTAVEVDHHRCDQIARYLWALASPAGERPINPLATMLQPLGDAIGGTIPVDRDQLRELLAERRVLLAKIANLESRIAELEGGARA